MPSPPSLPDFLPGRLTLERGGARDYAPLGQFHYLAKRPATWAGVWVVRYLDKPAELCSAAKYPGSRVIAVGVLSYPIPSCTVRERFFELQSSTRRQKLEFANRNLRTISRVIVHPQFRSLGLASILVRCLCEECPTRYVEALAVMGRVHPFFEKAGMTRIEPKRRDEPVYFIFDREKNEPPRRQERQEESDPRRRGEHEERTKECNRG